MQLASFETSNTLECGDNVSISCPCRERTIFFCSKIWYIRPYLNPHLKLHDPLLFQHSWWKKKWQAAPLKFYFWHGLQINIGDCRIHTCSGVLRYFEPKDDLQGHRTRVLYAPGQKTQNSPAPSTRRNHWNAARKSRNHALKTTQRVWQVFARNFLGP